MKKIIIMLLLLAFPGLSIKAQTWNTLSTGTNDWVDALKGDTLNILYAGGYFTQAGGNNIAHVAKWNGTNWSSLGTGVDQGVHALEIINGDLYVGGEFLNAGGNSAVRIAKYDGSVWTGFGNGLGGSVNAIAEYNGEIYAGGLGGLQKWNGTNWVELGSGIGGNNPYVSALKVYNSELYVAGEFELAGGLTANGIAKWNGSAWSIPGGTGLDSFGFAYALEVFNGELYVGGQFTTAGGIADTCLAKWNGTNWVAVNTGFTDFISENPSISSLKAINNSLFLGGYFDTIGNMPVNFVAKYDGTTFSDLGLGTNNIVGCLGSYNGNLIAGGQFLQAGGNTANYIAEWTGSNGIENIESKNEMIVYPNPSSNSINIHINSQFSILNSQLIITDVLGNEVYHQSINNSTQSTIDISNFSSGVYFYQLSNNKETVRGKFIKE